MKRILLAVLVVLAVGCTSTQIPSVPEVKLDEFSQLGDAEPRQPTIEEIQAEANKLGELAQITHMQVDGEKFTAEDAKSPIVRALLHALDNDLANGGGQGESEIDTPEARALIRKILAEADEELARSLGDNTRKKIISANQRRRAFYIPTKDRTRGSYDKNRFRQQQQRRNKPLLEAELMQKYDADKNGVLDEAERAKAAAEEPARTLPQRVE